jgi:5-hydroxyisourate hydrolase-like protein (transthyretin family)
VSGEPTLIDVAPVGGEVRRGFPFHLRGEVKSAGAPCPHVRVDVVLFSGVVKQGAAVGSLSTDDDGRFDGAVVIPRDFGLGEYRLRLETPGDARCRAGRSK